MIHAASNRRPLHTKIETSDPSKYPRLQFPIVLAGDLSRCHYGESIEVVPPNLMMEHCDHNGVAVWLSTTQDAPTVDADSGSYMDHLEEDSATSLHTFLQDLPDRLYEIQQSRQIRAFHHTFHQRIQTVHALVGSTRALCIGVEPNGPIRVITESELYRSDYDCFQTIQTPHMFQTLDVFCAWLAASGIVVPSGFVSACRSGSIGGSKTWEPEAHDVLALANPEFVSSWSLSYESADADPTTVSFSSLTEAMAALKNSGALFGIPGNSAHIALGSCELFSAHFASDGIDRGDSHIHPHMVMQRTPLYDSVFAAERADGLPSHSHVPCLPL